MWREFSEDVEKGETVSDHLHMAQLPAPQRPIAVQGTAPGSVCLGVHGRRKSSGWRPGPFTGVVGSCLWILPYDDLICCGLVE